MTGMVLEIRHNERDTQRNFALDKGFRDALADLCRRRWPTGTAKHAARAFGLTTDQGRSLVAGRSSLTTVEQVIKHGGWPIVFPLLAEVIGHSAEQYIAGARKSNAENGERLTALASHMLAVAGGADAAPGDLDNREAEQRRAFNR